MSTGELSDSLVQPSDSVLPERFCKNQFKSPKELGGYACAICVLEGKGWLRGTDMCTYQSAEHAQKGNSLLRVTVGGDGVCRDFEPVELTPDSTVRISN